MYGKVDQEKKTAQLIMWENVSMNMVVSTHCDVFYK